jgi:raffinose/stachyose/melibiose transport system substrate-binding protein
MRLDRMQRARRSRGALLTLAALLVLALALALSACGGSDSSSGDQTGEIDIVCGSCIKSPSDPSLTNAYEIAQSFNAKYRGRYHVNLIKNQYAGSTPDRVTYYQRLALANDLPDVFQVGQTEIRALARTGKLMDFTPVFDKDSAWRATFNDDAFPGVTEDGHIWALPQTRDAMGIFYNRTIFREAGVSEFPRTWDEFEATCRKIEATGKTCFAMDGDWVTLLMWVNLIGTLPGGADFLNRGIADTDYADNPDVVRATERLKQWHDDGFINSDAFSGEYQNAATAFIRGQAAMIANGPWMVNSDIKTKNAIKGLYDEIGYVGSPGWTADKPGLVVVSGTGSFASGTQDARKQEAVVAFLKYFTAHRQAIHQVHVEGAYPAVKLDPTPAEAKALEPLGLALNLSAARTPLIYPHALYAAPAPFENTWKNLWPAYVKGELDVKEFLSKLASDSQSTTAG